ncbi:MAG: NAAT family transporter [Verrucomicrobiales bacterium]|nr:NAAT family transporter [Verrucomicrobiales bacterium]
MTEPWMLGFLTSLFSMMNPLGNVGIFASLTSEQNAAETRAIAIKSAFSIFIILLISTWLGSHALAALGITVDELRTGGGIIILIIGLRMLFNNVSHAHTQDEADDAGNRASIATVPIAIPLVAGPGTISVVVAAAGTHDSLGDHTAITIIVLILAALTGLLFSQAQRISKALGVSGMAVVTRLMGMVLVAMAVGMVAKGAQALIPALGH